MLLYFLNYLLIYALLTSKAEPPQQPEQSDPSSHDQEVSDHDVTDSDATTEAYETEDDYQPNVGLISFRIICGN